MLSDSNKEFGYDILNQVTMSNNKNILTFNRAQSVYVAIKTEPVLSSICL